MKLILAKIILFVILILELLAALVVIGAFTFFYMMTGACILDAGIWAYKVCGSGGSRLRTAVATFIEFYKTTIISCIYDTCRVLIWRPNVRRV